MDGRNEILRKNNVSLNNTMMGVNRKNKITSAGDLGNVVGDRFQSTFDRAETTLK
jgi:hypothetical protein